MFWTGMFWSGMFWSGGPASVADGRCGHRVVRGRWRGRRPEWFGAVLVVSRLVLYWLVPTWLVVSWLVVS